MSQLLNVFSSPQSVVGYLQRRQHWELTWTHTHTHTNTERCGVGILVMSKPSNQSLSLLARLHIILHTTLGFAQNSMTGGLHIILGYRDTGRASGKSSTNHTIRLCLSALLRAWICGPGSFDAAARLITDYYYRPSFSGRNKAATN